MLPAAILVVLLACVLFAPALFAGKALSPSSSIEFAPPFASERPAGLARVPNRALNDNTILFEDHLRVAREAFRAGHLPLWDPYIGAGRPLGAGQGAPLFPTSWLAYVLPFWSSLGWIALTKLLLAGVGMALLCRALALELAPALLAGVCYAFSSLFIAFLGHGQVDAFALAPWGLLAAERLVMTGRATFAVGLGLSLGLALYNGHPESSFLMAVVIVLYLTYRLVGERRERDNPLRRRVLLAGGALVLATAVGAFALVALFEVLSQGVSLNQPGAEHAKLGDLFVGAVMPEFWGRPDKMAFNSPSTAIFSALYNGRPYLGVVPCLMAGIGLLRRPRGQQWFFIVLAALAAVLILGGVPVSAVRHLPAFSQINTFEYVWPLTLAGSVLAAYGLQRLLEVDPRLLRRAAVFVAVVAIAVIAEALRLRIHVLDDLPQGVADLPTLRPSETSANTAAAGALLRFLVIAATIIVALWAVRRPVVRRWVAFGLVAVSALDLALVDHGWWPMSRQREVSPSATSSLMAVQQAGPSWRLAGLGTAFTPDLVERYGVLDARVVDLPQITRYSDLFAALGGTVLPGFGQTVLDHLGTQQIKLLDVFSARWVFVRRAPSPIPAGLRVVRSAPGDRLLENTSAFPRAYVAYGSQSAHDLSAALRAIAGSDARSLYRAPVIEHAPVARALGPPTPAVLHDDTPNRETIGFVGRRPGWLIISDTFFPGWQASIDGRSVPIQLANANFRAIRVPAGRHVAVLSYRPTNEVLAFALSAAAVVATLACLVFEGLIRAVRHRNLARKPDRKQRRDEGSARG